VFSALAEISHHHKPVNVIYCDTGVEIPTISTYVKTTIKRLGVETQSLGLPFTFTIAKPKLDDRFFVKVIGRGYPPPTNIFRWCTDRLRINPVKSVIDRELESIIVLGIRAGESVQRDRTIERHRTTRKHYLKHGTSGSTSIFSPIVDYSVRDVWSTLRYLHLPYSVEHEVIGKLYKDAGAECPVFREAKGTPCGKGRFGCWTCTVVRRDKSTQSLVSNGYGELEPLFNFRNWLVAFRDDKEYRCGVRRNGTQGLGPITLRGREIILDRLLTTQSQSGFCLIEDEELKRIHELWNLDLQDHMYRDDANLV
jgi:DNA sulfur modification protein DndC